MDLQVGQVIELTPVSNTNKGKSQKWNGVNQFEVKDIQQNVVFGNTPGPWIRLENKFDHRWVSLNDDGWEIR